MKKFLLFVAAIAAFVGCTDCNKQQEVQREPAMALDGGEDGLIFYRAFCRLYPALLKPNGLLAFEIGEEQGEAVAAMMREAGLRDVTVLPDLAGLPRMVLGPK